MHRSLALTLLAWLLLSSIPVWGQEKENPKDSTILEAKQNQKENSPEKVTDAERIARLLNTLAEDQKELKEIQENLMNLALRSPSRSE
ncbi:MAG: hypothetical protein AB7P49_19345 [Bdellovibrionales bacterium]